MTTNTPFPKELHLVNKCRENKCSQSFGQLYSIYYESVYEYLNVILKNSENAFDITQETFITASQKIQDLRDPSFFRFWLFQIAKNNAMRFFRNGNKAKETLADFSKINPYLHDAAEEMEEKETSLARIDELLNMLTQEEQHLLIEKYYNKKSINKIAVEQNLGVSATKMKIHRARQKMKLDF